MLIYLGTDRLAIITVIGMALEDAIEVATGTAVAVSERAPRLAGFHEHVATILGDDPLVALFLHPGMMTPLTLKVTFEATVTLAVIIIAPR